MWRNVMPQEGGARKYRDNEVFERERSSTFYRRYKECNIGGEFFARFLAK